MARVSIAFAIQPDRPEDKRPLAVVAQDDQGVAIVPVPQDPEALARSLGLPSQTFVCWAESRQQMVSPLYVDGADPSRYDEVPVTDRRWLEAFTKTGYIDTHTFGPIEDVPGSATEVARATAKSLAG